MSGHSGQNTAKAMLWKLLERGGSQVITLAVQIVLARLLLPEDFGTLAVILVFINVGNVLVQSGLNMALVQAKDVKEGDYSGVFFASLAIAVVLYSILFLSAPVIERFYDLAGIAWYLRVLGILLFINSFNCIQIAYMTRNNLFNELCKCTLFAALCSGASGIVCALCELGLWSLIIQQVSNQVVLCILLFRVVPWKPEMSFDPKRIKSFFSFGWKVCVSNCINTLYQNAYDLVIGKAFSASALGYFSQGRKYPNALEAMFDEAIQAVMLPTLSRKQDDRTALKETLRKSLSVELCVIAPLMTLVALLAEPIVLLVLTDKWLPSVPYLQIFCISYIFAPLSSNNLQALYAIGRSDIVLKLEFLKKGIGISILTFTTLILNDLIAVAFGALAYSIIVVVINSWPNSVLLKYGLSEQARDYGFSFLCVAGAAVASIAATSFVEAWLLGVLAKFATFVLIYVILLWIVKPVGAGLLLDFVRSFLSKKTY